MINTIQENFSDDYFVSSDPAKLDLHFVHDWIANESYWAPGIPFKLLERALENSLCFGVYLNDGTQVGFGRIVTDYTTFAWVTDVFITPEQRGKRPVTFSDGDHVNASRAAHCPALAVGNR